MRWTSSLLAGALCVLASWASSRATCAQTVADKAAAESLFREGRKLMDAGRHAEACERFAASHKLAPAVGSALNLAACEQKIGRTASAWVHFNEAAALARRLGDDRRAKVANERAAALAPDLPHLRVDVPKRVAGLEVLRDGHPVDAALFGQSVPVDPGEHQISAEAPGHAPWQTTVSLEPRARLVVELPPLAPVVEKAPVIAARPAAEAEPPAATVLGNEPGEPKREGSNALAWTALGVGGAALVVGAIFGVRAISKSGDAQDRCPDYDRGVCADPAGRDANEAARSSATVSTVAFGAGAALAATGGLLLWWGRF